MSRALLAAVAALSSGCFPGLVLDPQPPPPPPGLANLCPDGVVEGNFAFDPLIDEASAIAALDDCTEITGDLVVDSTLLESLTLPLLALVGGDLVLRDNPELASVQLAALARVGGTLEIGDTARDSELALAELALPVLADVGGDGVVVGRRVDQLDGGALPALEAVALPLLRTARALSVNRTGAVEEVSAPGLESLAGPLTITDNPALAALELGALAAVDDSVSVARNPALTELAMPVLARVGPEGQARELQVHENGALADLTLPLVRQAVASFVNNPALHRCEAELVLLRGLADVAQTSFPNVRIEGAHLVDPDFVVEQAGDWLALFDLLQSRGDGDGCVDGALTIHAVPLGDPAADPMFAARDAALRALAHVGGALRFIGDGVEGPLSLPGLFVVLGDVEVRDTRAPSVSFDGLRFVGPPFFRGGGGGAAGGVLLSFGGNSALAALGVGADAQLVGIGIGSFKPGLEIYGNAALPTCAANALADRLCPGAEDCELTVIGNVDDACTDRRSVACGQVAFCADCGDGFANAGFCDDGNHVDGDGCDRRCNIETEPADGGPGSDGGPGPGGQTPCAPFQPTGAFGVWRFDSSVNDAVLNDPMAAGGGGAFALNGLTLAAAARFGPGGLSLANAAVAQTAGPPNLGTFTLEFWLRVDQAEASGFVARLATHALRLDGGSLGYQGSGQPQPTPLGRVDDGAFHVVALRCDTAPGAGAVFLDGALVAGGVVAVPCESAPAPTLALGAAAAGVPAVVDDVRLSLTALSEPALDGYAECGQCAASPACPDADGDPCTTPVCTAAGLCGPGLAPPGC